MNQLYCYELKMIEILRDNWEFILTIGATVLLFLIPLLLRGKSLSFQIISRIPLLNIQEKNKWDIQILFEKRMVQDVDLIEVEILNSGYEEIRPTDYERPIRIVFDENAQILNAEISKANPKNLNPAVKIEGTKVEIEPLLLNRKDKFTIKMLVSLGGKLVPSCRIAGVKDIKDINESKKNKTLYLILSGLIVGTLCLSILILIIPSGATSFLIIWSFYLIYSIIGYISMIIGIYMYIRLKKNKRFIV